MQQRQRHELVDGVVFDQQQAHALAQPPQALLDIGRGVGRGNGRVAKQVAVGRFAQRQGRRTGHRLARVQPDRETERTALPRLAGHRHLTVHQRHQALGDGQAQPGAAKASAQAGVGRHKRLKDQAQLGRRNADAGVGHGKAQMQAVRRGAARPQRTLAGLPAQQLGAQGNAALRGELDGIAQQVGHRLGQTRRVAAERVGHAVVGVDLQRQALVAHLLGHQAAGVRQQRLEREVDALQLQLAGLDLGQVEEVVDDPQQVARSTADAVQSLVLQRVPGFAAQQVGQSPRMAFIGVQISWLMLARKALLARLAASAWSRASASSALSCCNCAVRWSTRSCRSCRCCSSASASCWLRCSSWRSSAWVRARSLMSVSVTRSAPLSSSVAIGSTSSWAGSK